MILNSEVFRLQNKTHREDIDIVSNICKMSDNFLSLDWRNVPSPKDVIHRLEEIFTDVDDKTKPGMTLRLSQSTAKSERIEVRFDTFIWCWMANASRHVKRDMTERPLELQPSDAGNWWVLSEDHMAQRFHLVTPSYDNHMATASSASFSVHPSKLRGSPFLCLFNRKRSFHLSLPSFCLILQIALHITKLARFWVTSRPFIFDSSSIPSSRSVFQDSLLTKLSAVISSSL